MGALEVATKVAEIILKILEFIDKLKRMVTRFIKKINSYIDSLETFINKGIEKINSGLVNAQKWLEMKIDPIIKKINDAFDRLNKKIKEIIDGLKAWFDKIFNNIKTSIIRACLAKIGQDAGSPIGLAMLIGLVTAIPTPDITQYIPKIGLEINLPNFGEIFNLGQVQKVSIPKLPLIFGDMNENKVSDEDAKSAAIEAAATAGVTV